MSRQAVILAGGLGTRLRTVIGDGPKALAEVGGVPVLGHQLSLCGRCGFKDVVLLLGHAAEAVQSYVGDGSAFGVCCRFAVENKLLGTAGAVLAARKMLQPRFLVMYSDTLLDVDLDRFWRFAEVGNAAAALMVHPNDHPFDSDLVVTDVQGRVTGFSRWRHGGEAPLRNLASAALYVVRRQVLESFEARDGVLDFGRDVFPDLIARGERLIAYRSVEYIKDLGTPDRLAQVNRDLAEGRVDPQHFERRRPAVFLDRDGVLNVERNGVLKPDDMELLPGAGEGVQLLNKAGLVTVVVTNQPYIAFGKLSESGLDAIHAVMERDLAREGAFVDAVYHCPHHTEKGHAGERAELKFDCECRKPKAGMILSAAEDLRLDLRESWLVGDRAADIGAANKAGLRAILVRGEARDNVDVKEVCPDFVFENLWEAAHFIVERYPVLRAFSKDLARNRVTAGAQILVGGKARSGKSTAARVLMEALHAEGMEAIVLPLDSWRREWDDRDTSVLAHYRLDEIADVLARLRGSSRSLEITVPHYDRHARKKLAERTLICPPGAVVICEGVAALALDLPGALRLAVRVDEKTRLGRPDQLFRPDRERAAHHWSDWQIREAALLEALMSSATIFPEPQAKQP